MPKPPRRAFVHGRINQATDYFGVVSAKHYHDTVIAATYEAAGGDPETLPNPANWFNRLTPVRPRIEHGRWIADCPDGTCNGALMLVKGWPYVCPFCVRDDKQYWGIEWPSDADIARVEASLLQRPDVKTQNWNPATETVEQIIIETEESA